MTSVVAPNRYNPSEVVARETGYKPKTQTNVFSVVLISLSLNWLRNTHRINLCHNRSSLTLYAFVHFKNLTLLTLNQDSHSVRAALLSKELGLPGYVAYLCCDSELPLSSVFVFTRCKS